MAHLGSGRKRALTLPVGLALTASLGFLPTGTASAAPARETPSAAVSTDGPMLSYVVNTRGGHGTVKQVRKAVERAGGTVVIAYDRIGVIVAHSQDPQFAQAMRRVRGSNRRAPPGPTRSFRRPRRTSASSSR